MSVLPDWWLLSKTLKTCLNIMLMLIILMKVALSLCANATESTGSFGKIMKLTEAVTVQCGTDELYSQKVRPGKRNDGKKKKKRTLWERQLTSCSFSAHHTNPVAFICISTIWCCDGNKHGMMFTESLQADFTDTENNSCLEGIKAHSIYWCTF